MIEALWIDDECMSNGVLTAMGVEFIETAYKHGIKVRSLITTSLPKANGLTAVHSPASILQAKY